MSAEGMPQQPIGPERAVGNAPVTTAELTPEARQDDAMQDWLSGRPVAEKVEWAVGSRPHATYVSESAPDATRQAVEDRHHYGRKAADADSRYNTEVRVFADSMKESAAATRARGEHPDDNWRERHQAASQAVTDLGLGTHWKK